MGVHRVACDRLGVIGDGVAVVQLGSMGEPLTGLKVRNGALIITLDVERIGLSASPAVRSAMAWP